MIKTISFFKQDNLWYADVPNRTLEENEMVEGADVLLDFLSNNHDRITLTVSTTALSTYLLHLKMIEHNNIGATYMLGNDPEDTVWLCNVTHDVLEEHPEELYITEIKV